MTSIAVEETRSRRAEIKNYRSLKNAADFIEFIRRLYFPSAKQIEELDVPDTNYLIVEGKGSPESTEFQDAVQALYGLAYGLKMGLKFNKLTPKPKSYFDFKMPPLEGLWWQGDNTSFDVHDRDNWQWQAMIMMPPFVDQKRFQQARELAKAKHPEVPYDEVRLEEFREGRVIQLMHIGPYATEPETIKKLMNYMQKYNYQINGKHHEIYMGDPRRTKPEKLKTVLRYPVKLLD